MIWIALAALAWLLIKFGMMLVLIKLLTVCLTAAGAAIGVLLAIVLFPFKRVAKRFSSKAPANG
jgi:hypothetical protein